jgi:hypothetical protein
LGDILPAAESNVPRRMVKVGQRQWDRMREIQNANETKLANQSDGESQRQLFKALKCPLFQ